MRNLNLYMIATLIAAGLAVLSMPNNLPAREWSEEIRMTHAGEQKLLWVAGIADKSNRIRTLCNYTDAEVPDDFESNSQATYQVFDFEGNALTDPLIIGIVADYREGLVDGHSMALGSNDEAYILWSGRPSYTHFITIIDSSGEVIAPGIELEGISTRSIANDPFLFVDSNGNLIVVKCMRSERDLFYARYHPNGELIDSIRYIGWENQFVAHLYATLDCGDTLHVAYQENINNMVHFRYSKIAPNNDILVDDLSIDEVNGNQGIGITSIAVDASGRPLFAVTDFYYKYLVRLNHNYDMDIGICLGVNDYGDADSFIKYISNGNIYMLDSFFQDDRFGYNGSWLGYIEISDNGGIVDSLQMVHSWLMNEGGEAPARFSYPQIFVIDSSNVSVIWWDQRHARGRNGGELYMRNSLQENSISDEEYSLLPSWTLEQNYPNPFNGQSIFLLQGAFSENINLIVDDFAGRELFRALLPSTGNNIFFRWNGSDKFGNPLPAGSYIVTAFDRRNRQTRIVTIIR